MQNSSSAQSIYLIRHCDIVKPSTGVFGRTDVALSDAGRVKARKISSLFPGVRGLPVYASPQRRAYETAVLAFEDTPIALAPLAVEIDFGVLDGLTRADAIRLYPEASAYLDRYPLDARPFGGESVADVRVRAVTLARSFEDGRSIVLVSHLFFISVLASLLYPSRANEALCFGGGMVLHRHVGGGWTIA